MTKQDGKQQRSQPDRDRNPAPGKNQKTEAKPADDLPGADGQRSAGASEDTYD